MRADVVRCERVDQRLAPLSIHLRCPRQSTAARWIGPERQGQRLREMAHPPDAERLTTLHTARGDGVACHRGYTKVGTEKLRGRTNRRPVPARWIDQRSQRRAGHGTRGVDFDQQRMSTLREDTCEIGRARLG